MKAGEKKRLYCCEMMILGEKGFVDNTNEGR